MGNLPDDPLNTNNNVIYNDPDSISDQKSIPVQQPPIVPQSTRIQSPSGLEMPPIVPAKNENLFAESLNTAATERNPEKIPIPEIYTKQANYMPNNPPLQENSVQPSETPIPAKDKIVNETEKITSLHHIIETDDTLTKKADDEEEKFITEVEKHHGHL